MFTEVSLGNQLGLPFQTLNLTEFEDITQVYIASSGDVNFDNITANSIPEPSSLVGLLLVGSMGFCFRRKESQR